VDPLGIALVVIVALIVGVIMFILGQNKQRSIYAKTVGSAEQKSREIIDDAIRTAENKKIMIMMIIMTSKGKKTPFQVLKVKSLTHILQI